MVVFKPDGADVVMVHLFGPPLPMKYNKIQDLMLRIFEKKPQKKKISIKNLHLLLERSLFIWGAA